MKKILVLALLTSVPFQTWTKDKGGTYVVGQNGVPYKIEIPAQLAPIAAGDVDRSFGDPSTPGFTRDLSATSSFYAMVKDSSNRLVVCGFGGPGSTHQWIVARYTSSGVLDTTFNNPDGYVQETGIGVSEAHGLAITSGGDIVVVGYSTVASVVTWTVIEYNTSGAKVTAFGPNGTGIIQETELGAGTAYSVSIDTSGNLYVGGYTTPSSVTVITTISYTSAGARNASFNS